MFVRHTDTTKDEQNLIQRESKSQQQQQQEPSAPCPASSSAAPNKHALDSHQIITLHLHSFVYGKVAPGTTHNLSTATATATPTATAAVPPNSSGAPARGAISAALGAAETALLAAVVGTDEALAALPGGPVVGRGMEGRPLGKLCFGVLLWEALHCSDLMPWPVWIEKQLYVVSDQNCCLSVVVVTSGACFVCSCA